MALIFMKQAYLNKMIEFGLLPKSGRVLDLGCGIGKDSIFLAGKGYDVESVDIKDQTINTPKVKFIKSSITNFKIEENKYSAIIARNVLPFINDKAEVERILGNMVNGLTNDGCMFFTIFGLKDAWFGRENMSFFEAKEIEEILAKLPINIFEKNTMEGYGLTMKGDLKYWNVHSFFCTKRSLDSIIKSFPQVSQ